MTIVLLLGSVLNNHGAAEGRPPAEAVEKPMQQALQMMKLSQEQKFRIREIRQSTSERMKELRANLEKFRAELDRLLDSRAADETLKKSFIQLQNAKRVLEYERFQRVLAIRSVLTEEQKLSFQTMRSKATSASADTKVKALESSRE